MALNFSNNTDIALEEVKIILEDLGFELRLDINCFQIRKDNKIYFYYENANQGRAQIGMITYPPEKQQIEIGIEKYKNIGWENVYGRHHRKARRYKSVLGMSKQEFCLTLLYIAS